MVRQNATADVADLNDVALPEWFFRVDERRRSQ
jgi:hypothetical protein